jgi:hypothetical protein
MITLFSNLLTSSAVYVKMRAGQSPDIFCKHHFLKPLKMLQAELICILGWRQGGWPTLLGRGMGVDYPYHSKVNKTLKSVNKFSVVFSKNFRFSLPNFFKNRNYQ